MTAGVRYDLLNHKMAARQLKALRAELDAFEAVLTADAAKQRAEAAAQKRADQAYARRLEVYLTKNPHERARAIRLGMKELANEAFVADNRTSGVEFQNNTAPEHIPSIMERILHRKAA
jgi:hypothetical protein